MQQRTRALLDKVEKMPDCPDATCPRCVRRQLKAERELKALILAMRERQFPEMGRNAD